MMNEKQQEEELENLGAETSGNKPREGGITAVRGGVLPVSGDSSG